jgi:hypothetical protein
MSFICSRGSLKLFSIGNYEYEICRVGDQCQVLKHLYGYTLEDAMKHFAVFR